MARWARGQGKRMGNRDAWSGRPDRVARQGIMAVSLAFSSALLPSRPRSDKRGRALLILSALLGAINLSRAVSDPDLSREILSGVRDQLIGLVNPG